MQYFATSGLAHVFSSLFHIVLIFSDMSFHTIASSHHYNVLLEITIWITTYLFIIFG